MLQKTIKYSRKLPFNYKKNDFRLFEREITRKLEINKKIQDVKFIKVNKNGNIFEIFKYANYFIPKDEINLFLIKRIILILKVFLFALINHKPAHKIDEEVFIVHDVRSHGYYHFINDVGQKLELLKEKFPRKKIKIYFPGNINFSWVKKICEIYNFSFYYHSINKNIIFNNAKLVYPVSLSGNPEEKLFKKMNRRFNKFITKVKSSSNKKIYISREYAKMRNVKNEKKLINFLKEKKIKNYNFEKLSLDKQLNILKNTNTIIGPHGAGLINMVWLKPGSNIIEIRGNDDDWNNCYFSAASALNHNYLYITADTKKNFIFRNKIKNYSFNVRSFKDIMEIF